MHEIKLSELQQHLPAYLKQVRAGEEIWITSHGKVVARLLPPLSVPIKAKEALRKLRKHSIIGDVISPVGEKWDVE